VPSCGTCGIENSGTDRIYAVTLHRTASPGLRADLLYTVDGGALWNTSGITTLGLTDDPTGVACLSGYVVVIAVDGLHMVPAGDLNTLGAEAWTAITTGLVAGKTYNAISTGRQFAYIAAEDGYVYKTDDPLNGVEVAHAGDLTGQDLTAIHALNDSVVVAVGESNVVLYTLNGETWNAVAGPLVGVNLTAVWAFDASYWMVGTETGRLFYTLDEGASWTERRFNGSGSGKIWDIAFSNRSVGYVAHATTTPKGRILRTYNGGYSWNVLPEGIGALPGNDRVTSLAVSKFDPNIIIGGCLADDGVDGFVMIGQD
jgi:hypothetical protein